jgi:hypothetical protein
VCKPSSCRRVYRILCKLTFHQSDKKIVCVCNYAPNRVCGRPVATQANPAKGIYTNNLTPPFACVQTFVVQTKTCVVQTKTFVVRLQTCVVQLQTYVVQTKIFVVQLQTCVVQMKTCVVQTKTCVVRLQTCVVQMKTCVVHAQSWVVRVQTCVVQAKTFVVRIKTRATDGGCERVKKFILCAEGAARR